MFKKIKRILKKRKAKIFFFFLGCSATIWFLSNLSREYVGVTDFDLKYVNHPEGYLYKGASKQKMDVKLRAGGFTFLGFNFQKKKVEIDVSEAEKEGGRFYIPEKMYRNQIEKQLSESMALLEIDDDTLFLDMMAVKTKKVPIKPRGTMDLAQNYLLDGKLQVTPDSIFITGPPEEIDTIEQVRTLNTTLPDLASDFSEKVALFQSPDLKNTTYSESAAVLSGKVVRFSEKIIEVPIRVINVPAENEIKTFPEKVAIVCKAKTERLAILKPSDFQVVGDYETVKNGVSDRLRLQLKKKPTALHGAKLQTEEVEFILTKR